MLTEKNEINKNKKSTIKVLGIFMNVTIPYAQGISQVAMKLTWALITNKIGKNHYIFVKKKRKSQLKGWKNKMI